MGTNVGAVAVTAAGAIIASPAVLAGVVFRNSHATNAGVFRIYDNTSAATGTVLFVASLAAGAHVHHTYPGLGVQASKGLFLEITGSATVEGSVQIA